MVTIQCTGDEPRARVERAVEKVKNRLRRVVRALDVASIDYAVVGGTAVQIWVAQVDEAVFRGTRDVDIVIRGSDLQQAIEALTRVGFVYRRTAGIAMYLDGPDASARNATGSRTPCPAFHGPS